MFFVFKEYLNDNKNMNLIEKNEILDLFQQCYKDIGIIKNEDANKSEYFYNDDIELLSNLRKLLFHQKDIGQDPEAEITGNQID